MTDVLLVIHANAGRRDSTQDVVVSSIALRSTKKVIMIAAATPGYAVPFQHKCSLKTQLAMMSALATVGDMQ